MVLKLEKRRNALILTVIFYYLQKGCVGGDGTHENNMKPP